MARHDNRLSKAWVQKRKEVISHAIVESFPNLVILENKGVYVKDMDGKSYIDFSAQNCNVGHSNPSVLAAIFEQLQRDMDTSQLKAVSVVRIMLAEKLLEISPGGLSKGRVCFCSTGSEAAEWAIKLARCSTGKTVVVGALGSYHAGTFGGLSLSFGSSELKRYCGPLLNSTAYIPYPYCYRCIFGQEYPGCDFQCISAIEYILDTVANPEEVAAIFVEPIQTHGGVVVPPNGYFHMLRNICDSYGILLVDDEVVTGLGRTGRMFGIEHWNVIPDIMFLGKPLANGLPLGAIIARREIMDRWVGTHPLSGVAGNPVSCAASLKTIEVLLSEKLLENALKVGEHIMKRLKEMANEFEVIGDVRGKGLLIGVELVKGDKGKIPATEETKNIQIEAFKRGLLMLIGGIYKQVLRITPPLNITLEEAGAGLDILYEAFKSLLK
jgi:4-aminobutyrate aminotransferase